MELVSQHTSFANTFQTKAGRVYTRKCEYTVGQSTVTWWSGGYYIGTPGSSAYARRLEVSFNAWEKEQDEKRRAQTRRPS